MKLGLIRVSNSEVSKPRLKYNLLGKQDQSALDYEALRITEKTYNQFLKILF